MLRHDIEGKKLLVIWNVGIAMLMVPILLLSLQVNDTYCDRTYYGTWETPSGNNDEDWTVEEYEECLEADDKFYQTFRNVHPGSFVAIGTTILIIWVRFCFRFYREELKADT